MLNFPSIPERRSIGNSSYLSHLTSSPGISPNHSNQSSPRYGLYALANHQPRRLSVHVALRIPVEPQQPAQFSTEESIAKQSKYHLGFKNPHIKQDVLLETGDSNITTKGPYIPSNNAFNMDSFMRSSEDKTVNTLSITKGISEFDATIPESTTHNKIKAFRSRGISIFAPKQGKVIKKAPTRESLDSILNSSFEKELAGTNSLGSSEQELFKVKSRDKISGESTKKVNEESLESSEIMQVPLARIMRRRSCCCSECGILSKFEKKHQNLTNPGRREEMHIMANENAKRLLLLEQKRALTAYSKILEDNVTKDQTTEDNHVKTIIIRDEGAVFHTEGFQEIQTLETQVRPPMMTDMDSETTDRLNFNRKGSDFIQSAGKKKQGRRTQKSHSPKTFIVKKNPKESLIYSKAGMTQSLLPFPFSGPNTRKNSIILLSKVDSPVPQSGTPVNLNGGLQQKLAKLEKRISEKSKEENSPVKKKMEKMKTLSDVFTMKKSFRQKMESPLDLNILPGLQSRFSQGSIKPKVKLTLGKQSIQGVYAPSSGNSTPKLPSVNNSPINKTESLNLTRDLISKPRVCIITNTATELRRKESANGYRQLEGKEEEMKTASKYCVTTLETIDMFSGVKLKESLAFNLPEEDEEEEEETGRSGNRDVQRKKKRQCSLPGTIPGKRSVSVGMMVKAYQASQSRGNIQMKKL